MNITFRQLEETIYLMRGWMEEHDKCTTVWEKQDLYRKYYAQHESQILSMGQDTHKAMFNPYPFDWNRIFTPIEDYAWQAIRCRGMALYPQYPVLNYILDFGNPTLKIGLELDGKDYHDIKRDTARDQEIFDKTGWRIFRVTGSEANRLVIDIPDFYPADNEDSKSLWDFLCNSLEGVIEALYQTYFVKPNYDEGEEEEMEYDYDWDSFLTKCKSALNEHRLADFSI